MTICGRCLIECSALRQKHNAGKGQYTKCTIGAPSRLTLKKFNISTNLLLLIVQNAGVSYLIYYLDDYPTIGPLLFPMCQCT